MYKDYFWIAEFYKNNNIKYRLLDKLPINYPCKYVLESNDSYVFNPYEYLVSLKNIVKEKNELQVVEKEKWYVRLFKRIKMMFK